MCIHMYIYIYIHIYIYIYITVVRTPLRPARGESARSGGSTQADSYLTGVNFPRTMKRSPRIPRSGILSCADSYCST